MTKTSFMRLALEEIEQQEIVEQIKQDNQESQQSGEAEQDQCIADMTNAEDDIAEHLDYISEVVDDTSDVQDIADFTEDAQQEGIDSTTAQILDVATESLYTRLGVRPKVNHYAAEDFGSKTTKVNSTKLAVEGFKEFIKAMWGAIKTAFKKMSLYLKRYIDLVFDQNTVTIRNANSLRDKIKRTPIDNNNKALLSNEKLEIVVSNKFFNLSSAESSEAFVFDEQGLKAGEEIVVKTSELIDTFIKYLDKNSDLKELVENESNFNSIIYPNLSKSFVSGAKGVYFSKPFIGSRKIQIKTPENAQGKTGLDSIVAIEKTSIELVYSSLSFNNLNSDSNSRYDIAAVNPTTQRNIIDTVIAVSERIAKSKSIYTELTLKHDKMINEIDSVEQAAGQKEEEYAQYKSRVIHVRTFAKEINRLTSEMITVTSGSLVKSCHAALEIVEQSYSTYLKYQ